MSKMLRYFDNMETSYYSEHPTRRWCGTEFLIEDYCIEYPEELDALSEEELRDRADNEEGGVRYVPYEEWDMEEYKKYREGVG